MRMGVILLMFIFSVIIVFTFAMAKLSSEISRQEEQKEIYKNKIV